MDVSSAAAVAPPPIAGSVGAAGASGVAPNLGEGVPPEGAAPPVASLPPAPTGPVGTPSSSGAPPSVGFGPAPANGDGKVVSSVARFFGPPSNPHPVTLNVSYRVLHHPNEIVTVFSDPQTNQEVAQFPPEILIGIAEFFDQHQGVTLDSNA
ncbi:MAG: hypothetical protein HKL91_04470 [Candidatus Eremiobacteraeota bacterium]|uniref:Uncharacterized protein n=1 Tax=mine drainage metagenome TaxID=410659 RepID=E6PCB2_9ZZZZ|nr:hypothetical protein [Candidatus Eremiobacteraeota bacterium]